MLLTAPSSAVAPNEVPAAIVRVTTHGFTGPVSTNHEITMPTMPSVATFSGSLADAVHGTQLLLQKGALYGDRPCGMLALVGTGDAQWAAQLVFNDSSDLATAIDQGLGSTSYELIEPQSGVAALVTPHTALFTQPDDVLV